MGLIIVITLGNLLCFLTGAVMMLVRKAETEKGHLPHVLKPAVKVAETDKEHWQELCNFLNYDGSKMPEIKK